MKYFENASDELQVGDVVEFHHHRITNRLLTGFVTQYQGKLVFANINGSFTTNIDQPITSIRRVWRPKVVVAATKLFKNDNLDSYKYQCDLIFDGTIVEAKELTVAEISELVGYEVKIVKGSK